MALAAKRNTDMKPFQAVTRLATTMSLDRNRDGVISDDHLDGAITSIVAPGKLSD